MNNLSKNERRLTSDLLKISGREFANHGANDVPDKLYDGWTAEEREQFVKEFHEYNGDPEEFDPKHLHLPDFALMAFLAHKIYPERNKK